MGTWGGAQNKKSLMPAELRRKLGEKFHSSLEELVALARSAKIAPKIIPYAPPADAPVVAELEEPFVGPCQLHVANMRAWRDAKAAGAAAPVVEEDAEPYVDEREMTRLYNRQRYREMKAQGKLPKKKRTLSPETRAKMSLARLGKTVSPETRAKIGLAGLGKRVMKVKS